jgi:hypothetical protein
LARLYAENYAQFARQLHCVQEREASARDKITTIVVMSPVLQAAAFRTYGRLTGALCDVADDIVQGISAAIANQEAER